MNAACVGPADDASGAGGGSGAGGDGALGAPDVGALAVGAGQRCLTTRGRLYCWGTNIYGQAGGDPLHELREPRWLREVPDAVELAAGNYHTCARTQDGDVYCWGYNSSGEIGAASAARGTCPDHVLDSPGEYPCQPTPTRVAAVSGARQVAVGDHRSCAVLGDGRLECWGDVADISEWAATITAAERVALGASGVCVVTTGGDVDCSSDAVELRDLRDVKTLVLSSNAEDPPFGCALGSAGDVHCWGDDTYGQLGQADAASQPTSPLRDASQIVATRAGACALLSDGSVWCWGKNTDGEAGLTPLASPNCGPETCETSPQRVRDLPRATRLAAGGSTTCAVAEDATIWCWGGGDLLRSPGAPKRVPGRWEGGDPECVSAAVGAAQAVTDGVFNSVSHYCESDLDCTSVALDLPCLPSCHSVPITRADSESVATAIASAGHQYCDAAPAGCVPHEPSCSASTDVDVCVDSTCVRMNRTSSGCSDACSCQAQRYAASVVARGDCVGPDLWVVVSVSCKSCGPGGAWFVIGNRGDTKFSGSATLSFDRGEPDSAGPLPEAQSLELTLAPGELTSPLYVQSRAEVYARPRITAAGDCAPENDASSEVTFPSAQLCPQDL